jgi:hypothetical protein
MEAEFRVFLSAVTSEFGSTRDALKNDLQARGLSCKYSAAFVQEPLLFAPANSREEVWRNLASLASPLAVARKRGGRGGAARSIRSPRMRKKRDPMGGRGWNRPATLMNNLGLMLNIKSLHAQVELLNRRVFTIGAANFGPNHRKSLPTSTTSAGCCETPTGWLRPNRSFGEPWRSMRASFGLDHPNVALLLANLAAFLHTTGRLAHAKWLMRHLEGILIDFEHKNGHIHTRTAIKRWLTIPAY